MDKPPDSKVRIPQQKDSIQTEREREKEGIQRYRDDRQTHIYGAWNRERETVRDRYRQRGREKKRDIESHTEKQKQRDKDIDEK